MRFFHLTAIICSIFALTSCQTLETIQSSIVTDKSKLALNSSDEGDKTAIGCPAFNVVEDLDTYYEIPASFEGDNDVGFAMAHISKLSGTCTYEDDKVVLNMDLEFEASPGPFSKLDQGDNSKLSVPYFIAVLDENKKIIAKDVFNVPLDLGMENIGLIHKETLQQIIPLTAQRKPEKYEIMSGFQLKKEQLDYARQRKAADTLPAAGSEETPDPLANEAGSV